MKFAVENFHFHWMKIFNWNISKKKNGHVLELMKLKKKKSIIKDELLKTIKNYP